MAKAYTPGLTIKERTTVEKIRRLPLKGDVLVEEGTEVEADTVVARTHLPGNVYPMNGASILNIEPKDLPGKMAKRPGDPVEKGEVLARSRGFFGFFKTPLVSPVAGSLESVSSVTGQLIFREPPIPVEVKGYVQGRVVQVYPHEGVKIRTRAAFIQGIFGIGGEAQGRIEIRAAGPTAELRPEEIRPGDEGKILVAGAFITSEAFRRAEDLGVAGIVTGGIRYGDLKEILGYEIGVAITGSEQVKTVLVVTEGFGTIPIAARTFELIRRFAGRAASINGATQIRAGVIRPELIIPLGRDEGDEADGPGAGEPVLEKGVFVRVIRTPHFGTIGRVVELPHELRRVDSETFTRVVVIQAEGGGEFELPRANVEIIDQ